MKSGNRAQSRPHPKQSDIDELLGFLSKLRSLKGRYTTKDAGIEKNSDGTYVLNPPEYVPVVYEFFRIASKRCWSDYKYDPVATAKMFEDPTLINNATLDQIRTVLTWCVRGERFCDGHWAAVLSSGRIFSLLDRLQNIRHREVKERSSMRTEVLPFSYRIKKRFPRMRNIEAFEGGAMSAAEKDGKFYIILDERTMSEFLDDDDNDLRDKMLRVLEFDNEQSRQHYINKRKREKVKNLLRTGKVVSQRPLVADRKTSVPSENPTRISQAGHASPNSLRQRELFNSDATTKKRKR